MAFFFAVNLGMFIDSDDVPFGKRAAT